MHPTLFDKQVAVTVAVEHVAYTLHVQGTSCRCELHGFRGARLCCCSFNSQPECYGSDRSTHPISVAREAFMVCRHITTAGIETVVCCALSFPNKISRARRDCQRTSTLSDDSFMPSILRQSKHSIGQWPIILRSCPNCGTTFFKGERIPMRLRKKQDGKLSEVGLGSCSDSRVHR